MTYMPAHRKHLTFPLIARIVLVGALLKIALLLTAG